MEFLLLTFQTKVVKNSTFEQIADNNMFRVKFVGNADVLESRIPASWVGKASIVQGNEFNISPS